MLTVVLSLHCTGNDRQAVQLRVAKARVVQLDFLQDVNKLLLLLVCAVDVHSAPTLELFTAVFEMMQHLVVIDAGAPSSQVQPPGQLLLDAGCVRSMLGVVHELLRQIQKQPGQQAVSSQHKDVVCRLQSHACRLVHSIVKQDAVASTTVAQLWFQGGMCLLVNAFINHVPRKEPFFVPDDPTCHVPPLARRVNGYFHLPFAAFVYDVTLLLQCFQQLYMQAPTTEELLLDDLVATCLAWLLYHDVGAEITLGSLRLVKAVISCRPENISVLWEAGLFDLICSAVASRCSQTALQHEADLMMHSYCYSICDIIVAVMQQPAELMREWGLTHEEFGRLLCTRSVLTMLTDSVRAIPTGTDSSSAGQVKLATFMFSTATSALLACAGDSFKDDRAATALGRLAAHLELPHVSCLQTDSSLWGRKAWFASVLCARLSWLRLRFSAAFARAPASQVTRGYAYDVSSCALAVLANVNACCPIRGAISCVEGIAACRAICSLHKEDSDSSTMLWGQVQTNLLGQGAVHVLCGVLRRHIAADGCCSERSALLLDAALQCLGTVQLFHCRTVTRLRKDVWATLARMWLFCVSPVPFQSAAHAGEQKSTQPKTASLLVLPVSTMEMLSSMCSALGGWGPKQITHVLTAVVGNGFVPLAITSLVVATRTASRHVSLNTRTFCAVCEFLRHVVSVREFCEEWSISPVDASIEALAVSAGFVPAALDALRQLSSDYLTHEQVRVTVKALLDSLSLFANNNDAAAQCVHTGGAKIICNLLRMEVEQHHDHGGTFVERVGTMIYTLNVIQAHLSPEDLAVTVMLGESTECGLSSMLGVAGAAVATLLVTLTNTKSRLYMRAAHLKRSVIELQRRFGYDCTETPSTLLPSECATTSEQLV